MEELVRERRKGKGTKGQLRRFELIFCSSQRIQTHKRVWEGEEGEDSF